MEALRDLLVAASELEPKKSETLTACVDEYLMGWLEARDAVVRLIEIAYIEAKREEEKKEESSYLGWGPDILID